MDDIAGQSLSDDKMGLLSEEKTESSNFAWSVGLRIIDFGELAKQMYCNYCKVLLDLNRTQREERVGLASVFFVVCNSCGFTNEVCSAKRQKISNKEQPLFEVNVKASSSVLFHRHGGKFVVSFLTSLEIPLPPQNDPALPGISAPIKTENGSDDGYRKMLEMSSDDSDSDGVLPPPPKKRRGRKPVKRAAAAAAAPKTGRRGRKAGASTTARAAGSSRRKKSSPKKMLKVKASEPDPNGKEPGEIDASDEIAVSGVGQASTETPKPAKPAKPGRPPPKDGGMACHMCSALVSSHRGLKIHLARKHGIINQYIGKPTPDSKKDSTENSTITPTLSVPVADASKAIDAGKKPQNPTPVTTGLIASNSWADEALVSKIYGSDTNAGETRTVAADPQPRAGVSNSQYEGFPPAGYHSSRLYEQDSNSGGDFSMSGDMRQRTPSSSSHFDGFQAAGFLASGLHAPFRVGESYPPTSYGPDFRGDYYSSGPRISDHGAEDLRTWGNFASSSRVDDLMMPGSNYHPSGGNEARPQAHNYSQNFGNAENYNTPSQVVFPGMYLGPNKTIEEAAKEAAKAASSAMYSDNQDKPQDNAAPQQTTQPPQSSEAKQKESTDSSGIEQAPACSIPEESEPPASSQGGEKTKDSTGETSKDKPKPDLTINKSKDGIMCGVYGCGKLFKNEKKYRKHLQNVHKLTQPHQCLICSKIFSEAKFLKAHITRHHSSPESREVECSWCEKKLPNNKQLKDHIKRVHPKGSTHTFYCKLCPAMFDYRFKLKRHMLEHTGERPYQCYYCELRFKSSSNRLNHVQMMHEDRKFLCDTCGAGFTRNCALQEHKRLHTGEKPFQCHVCAERFAKKEYLKVHIRTHTGERPYVCAVCNKAFTQRTTLSIHRRKVHGMAKQVRVGSCYQQSVPQVTIRPKLDP